MHITDITEASCLVSSRAGLLNRIDRVNTEMSGDGVGVTLWSGVDSLYVPFIDNSIADHIKALVVAALCREVVKVEDALVAMGVVIENKVPIVVAVDTTIILAVEG